MEWKELYARVRLGFIMVIIEFPGMEIENWYVCV